MNKHKTKSKQTTRLYKTLNALWVCAHPYTHCRSLVHHASWVWRHPCFAKERNLSLVHPCLLKGWDRIFPLHAGTLSGHFAMVIHWHCTLFLPFCGSVLTDISSHLLFATDLKLFGFILLLFILFVCDKRDILKYVFEIKIHDIRLK